MDGLERIKGNIALTKAIAWLTENQYEVFVPLFDNGTRDLIAEKDNLLYKISVKYTSSVARSGNYNVALRTVSRRAYNKTSQNRFDNSKFDFLLVYVAPEDLVVKIDAVTIKATCSIVINPKLYMESIRPDEEHAR